MTLYPTYLSLYSTSSHIHTAIHRKTAYLSRFSNSCSIDVRNAHFLLEKCLKWRTIHKRFISQFAYLGELRMLDQVYVMPFPDSIGCGARQTLLQAGTNVVIISSWISTGAFPPEFLGGNITTLFIADDCFFGRAQHIQWAPSVEAAIEREWRLPKMLARFVENVPATSVLIVKRSSCMVGTVARGELQKALLTYHHSNADTPRRDEEPVLDTTTYALS
ncbi:MAG: hypothetical protein JWL75_469 [Parcubacteria group bacterium]|nr:hypothetical protein [Parcubacteria group bacterium]